MLPNYWGGYIPPWICTHGYEEVRNYGKTLFIQSVVQNQNFYCCLLLDAQTRKKNYTRHCETTYKIRLLRHNEVKHKTRRIAKGNVLATYTLLGWPYVRHCAGQSGICVLCPPSGIIQYRTCRCPPFVLMCIV